MNWIKGKLRGWLFPEYCKVCNFMTQVEGAKLELKGKNITFKEPIVLVGSMADCNVQIKPTIKPEIILAKLDLEAALKVAGDYSLITQNMFNATETTVKQG